MGEQDQLQINRRINSKKNVDEPKYRLRLLAVVADSNLNYGHDEFDFSTRHFTGTGRRAKKMRKPASKPEPES